MARKFRAGIVGETTGRADRELKRNRRIRERTYGGVRGREPKGSLLLDAVFFV